MDDDIKIYRAEDVDKENNLNSEDSANLFLFHKENGNINKTNEMGELLANCFLNTAKRFKDDEYYNQKLTLISFLMFDELATNIDDEILQKSVKGSFKKHLVSQDKDVSDIITDSVAYTLYIIEDRKRKGDMGRIYSELCGRTDDSELISEGNAIEQEYRSLFADIISTYTFKTV